MFLVEGMNLNPRLGHRIECAKPFAVRFIDLLDGRNRGLFPFSHLSKPRRKILASAGSRPPGPALNALSRVATSRRHEVPPVLSTIARAKWSTMARTTMRVRQGMATTAVSMAPVTGALQ